VNDHAIVYHALRAGAAPWNWKQYFPNAVIPKGSVPPLTNGTQDVPHREGWGLQPYPPMIAYSYAAIPLMDIPLTPWGTIGGNDGWALGNASDVLGYLEAAQTLKAEG